MSGSERLPKTRVTFVLSEGFLKMARMSWYILFFFPLSVGCFLLRLVLIVLQEYGWGFEGGKK